MLDRGQLITILKSSVSGKEHPAPGDMGYINNAYVLPKLGFILIDAFFFYYSKSKSNTDRCERKKFIVDVCMSPYMKRKISGGIRIPDIRKDTCRFNLNTIDYNSGLEYPSISGEGNSMFPVERNVEVKIPFGEVIVNRGPRNLSLCETGEIKAWIRSQLSLLVLKYVRSDITVNSITKMALRLPVKMCNVLKRSEGGEGEWILKNDAGREEMIKSIYHMRQLQAAGQIFLYDKMIGDGIKPINIQKDFKKRKSIEMLSSPYSSKVKMLLGLMMKPRSKQKFHEDLLKFKLKIGVPTYKDMISIVETSEPFRKDFQKSSKAALNRLMRENIYINSLFIRR